MDKPVDNSNFYTKFYTNPKKIKKRIDRYKKLYNQSNVGESMRHVL